MKQGSVTIIELDDLFTNYESSNFENMNIRDINHGEVLSQVNVSDVVIFYDKNIDINKIIKNRYGSTDKLGVESLYDITLIEKLRIFWFSRWLATNYEGYLNEEGGVWYLEQMRHFYENVFPTMLQTEINSGNFETTIGFIRENY